MLQCSSTTCMFLICDVSNLLTLWVGCVQWWRISYEQNAPQLIGNLKNCRSYELATYRTLKEKMPFSVKEKKHIFDCIWASFLEDVRSFASGFFYFLLLLVLCILNSSLFVNNKWFWMTCVMFSVVLFFNCYRHSACQGRELEGFVWVYVPTDYVVLMQTLKRHTTQNQWQRKTIQKLPSLKR